MELSEHQMASIDMAPVTLELSVEMTFTVKMHMGRQSIDVIASDLEKGERRTLELQSNFAKSIFAAAHLPDFVMFDITGIARTLERGH